GPTQLRRRDHLHGRGDLLRRLHAVDAVLEVLEAWHTARFRRLSEIRPGPERHPAQAKVLAKLSRAAFSFASVSSDRARSWRIASRIPPWLARISDSIAASNRFTSSTFTGSR